MVVSCAQREQSVQAISEISVFGGFLNVCFDVSALFVVQGLLLLFLLKDYFYDLTELLVLGGGYVVDVDQGDFFEQAGVEADSGDVAVLGCDWIAVNV